MPLLLEPPPASRIHEDDLPPEIPYDDDGGWDGDDDENDPTRWVTVATFWQPTHAHIARLKLESEDIDCMIIDENLVATDWLYASAVGGIKLQVPEPVKDAIRPRRTAIGNTDDCPVIIAAGKYSDGIICACSGDNVKEAAEQSAEYLLVCRYRQTGGYIIGKKTLFLLSERLITADQPADQLI